MSALGRARLVDRAGSASPSGSLRGNGRGLSRPWGEFDGRALDVTIRPRGRWNGNMLAPHAAPFAGAALVLACVVAACSSSPEQERSRSAAPTGASAEPPSPPPPAQRRLSAPSALVDLPVEGHLPALVSLPIGATRPRPVAVVAHGNWGGPHWDCPLWRGLLGADVFILCPRGVPRADQRPRPSTPDALAAEIDAGLAALRRRFGDFVEEGPVLYAGCSRGAFLGAKLGQRDAARFPRLALIEGGHDPWTPEGAKRFAEGGGERVLFACGQSDCFVASTAKARVLRAAGVEASVAYAPFMGHICHDRVAEETKRAMPWLLTGDERWPPMT
jgi:pimeloyl-ACP methyl ester carboxylesterase